MGTPKPAAQEQRPCLLHAAYRTGQGRDSEHAAEYLGVCTPIVYSYCMISPIRGIAPVSVFKSLGHSKWLCREFCDVLRIVRCLGALLLAACAGNVTIWDSCGVPA